MRKRASSSTTDNPSKKRRTRLVTVVGTTSAPGPSGTRHVRLTQSTKNRFTQKRLDRKNDVLPQPSSDPDSLVEPDDAIDEWVNEDEAIPRNDTSSVKVPAPKKRKSKSTSVSNSSFIFISSFVGCSVYVTPFEMLLYAPYYLTRANIYPLAEKAFQMALI